MEPLSPSFGDEMMHFNSALNDMDSDFMKQWNIESCFGNGNIVIQVYFNFYCKLFLNYRY